MLRVSPYKIRFSSWRAPRPCSPSHIRSERGQTLVETALCCIVLLAILFGIIQASLAAYSYHFVAEAAREGSRWAMVRGSTCIDGSGVIGACTATAAQIKSYVTGLGFPGIDTRPAAMTVNVTWCTPAGSVPPACTAGPNDPGNIVRVAITYNFPLAVPFLTASTIALTSSSQTVISQ